MKKITFYIIIIFLQSSVTALYSFVSANSEKTEVSNDSVSYIFPEINVNADRILSNSAIRFSPNSVINSEKIEKSAALQASEILNSIPGMYIKDYGGLSGLKTISLRGTSAQQTLVMLDGMRLNSMQNNISDIGLLPISVLEDIEVVKGGSSGIFGGNAIGGVINFRTKTSNFKDKINLRIGYGSFDEKIIALNTEKKFDSSAVFFTYQYLASDGNYPFAINQFGKTEELLRKNSDFLSHSFSAAFADKRNGWTRSATLLGSSSERGVPGPAVKNNYYSIARAEQNNVNLIISIKKQINDNNSFFLGFMTNFDQYEYNDPYGRAEGMDDIFINRGLQAKIAYNCNTYGNDINLFIEPAYSELNGDMMKSNKRGYVNRKSLGASLQLERNIFQNEVIDLSLLSALRLDAISDIKGAISPLFGLMTVLNEWNLTLKTQYSYNFRAPSFNEMYYYNFGSKDLEPERAHSFNIGAAWFATDGLHIEGNLFSILTEKQIAAYPTRPDVWTAINIGKVFTRGAELNVSASFFSNSLNFWLSYTRQLATDETKGSLTKSKVIPYIPEELFYLSVDYDFRFMSAELSSQYSSYRYTMSDNSLNSVLPSYFIINADISKEIDFNWMRLVLRLKSRNIFDKQYEIISNYPMPGRAWIIELVSKI